MSLTDTLGSLAVASNGHFMTGVSTDIGTSFVRPSGRTGDMLYATSTLTGIGKSLAYTRTEFKNSNGDLLAYGCEYRKPRTSRDTLSRLCRPYKVRWKIIFSSCKSNLCMSRRCPTSRLQKNVKFSDDGEDVIEGDDLEID